MHGFHARFAAELGAVCHFPSGCARRPYVFDPRNVMVERCLRSSLIRHRQTNLVQGIARCPRRASRACRTGRRTEPRERRPGAGTIVGRALLLTIGLLLKCELRVESNGCAARLMSRETIPAGEKSFPAAFLRLLDASTPRRKVAIVSLCPWCRHDCDVVCECRCRFAHRHRHRRSQPAHDVMERWKEGRLLPSGAASSTGAVSLQEGCSALDSATNSSSCSTLSRAGGPRGRASTGDRAS